MTTTIADVAAHLIRQRGTTCAAPEFIAAYLTHAAGKQYADTVADLATALARYYDSPCDGCGGPIGLNPWTWEHPHGEFRSFCSWTCLEARRVFGSRVVLPRGDRRLAS